MLIVKICKLFVSMLNTPYLFGGSTSHGDKIALSGIMDYRDLIFFQPLQPAVYLDLLAVT